MYPKLSILQNNCQHGFRKRRLTSTQLFTYLESFYRNADRNIPRDSIYYDFSKAFDIVAIDILLQKLSKFGLDDGFLKLFSSCSQNRVQRVKVRNSVSSAKHISSGISQGSILGPLLFLIYINDLPEHIRSQVCLFADDSKILCTGPNIFNADIGHFTYWSDTNRLSINLPKCQYFVQALIPNSTTVLGTKIEKSALIKGLGLSGFSTS